MKRLSSFFYDKSRDFGKMASKLNDIETLFSLNPSKIFKRFTKKPLRKFLYKTTNKLTSGKILKK